MAEQITEYTVRDYSAVDAQINEIADREKIVTQKLKLENLKKFIFLGCVILLALGCFILLAAIAYRIAFPPNPDIIEKTEIIEKVIEPQKIIIQTPTGTITSNGQISSGNGNITPSNGQQLGKFFGENPSSEASDNTLKSETSNEALSANEQQEAPQNNGAGKRTVHTFTSVASNHPEFKVVTTGWRWVNVNDNQPASQYCYSERRIAGKKEVLDLANIETANGQLNELPYKSSAGVAKSVWNDLINSCRWFSQ